jgi:murein DD-endopeptidase MepM/ murein hydrolase activator NlpD
MYPILTAIFFLTIILTLLIVIGAILKPAIYQNHRHKIKIIALSWYLPYAVFIIFFTGPVDLSKYPPQESSPYKLPWRAGVSRYVAQGNRSFTSHRGFHMYAWDFVMPTGTEVLAAREGRVIEAQDSYDGIGLNSNGIIIEHSDGQQSAYAHIKHGGALVKVGDMVKQGQPIALSGMVGQAPGPHLHFYVINKERTSSIPISFSDVPGGVPFACHFYTSENHQ